MLDKQDLLRDGNKYRFGSGLLCSVVGHLIFNDVAKPEKLYLAPSISFRPRRYALLLQQLIAGGVPACKPDEVVDTVSKLLPLPNMTFNEKVNNHNVESVHVNKLKPRVACTLKSPMARAIWSLYGIVLTTEEMKGFKSAASFDMDGLVGFVCTLNKSKDGKYTIDMTINCEDKYITELYSLKGADLEDAAAVFRVDEESPVSEAATEL